VRQRWFGSTGRRVPQIAAEGEVDLEGALVLDQLDDAAIEEAFDEGRPVVIRAGTREDVLEALRRPEVSSVVVPPELADLDVVGLTYG
jgi:hypothetical protein